MSILHTMTLSGLVGLVWFGVWEMKWSERNQRVASFVYTPVLNVIGVKCLGGNLCNPGFRPVTIYSS